MKDAIIYKCAIKIPLGLPISSPLINANVSMNYNYRDDQRKCKVQGSFQLLFICYIYTLCIYTTTSKSRKMFILQLLLSERNGAT